MKRLSSEEILTLMKDRDLDVLQVIDVVIETNHLIGVGLVDLENLVTDYIREKCKEVSKTPRGMEMLND
jgi:hypothetical protein